MTQNGNSGKTSCSDDMWNGPVAIDMNQVDVLFANYMHDSLQGTKVHPRAAATEERKRPVVHRCINVRELPRKQTIAGREKLWLESRSV